MGAHRHGQWRGRVLARDLTKWAVEERLHGLQSAMDTSPWLTVDGGEWSIMMILSACQLFDIMPQRKIKEIGELGFYRAEAKGSRGVLGSYARPK